MNTDEFKIVLTQAEKFLQDSMEKENNYLPGYARARELILEAASELPNDQERFKVCSPVFTEWVKDGLGQVFWLCHDSYNQLTTKKQSGTKPKTNQRSVR